MIRAITRWLAERRAAELHAALVDEAREDWSVVQTYKVQCVWSDHDDELAGYWVFAAEQNGLGDRRAVIVARPPSPWPQEGEPKNKVWASLKEWEARAERKSIPRKEIAW